MTMRSISSAPVATLCIALLLSSLLLPCFGWNLPLGGGRQVQFQDGILRINLNGGVDDTNVVSVPPPTDATIDPSTLECLQVRDTGNELKGYGTFCIKKPIPKHTFLGFYEGILIQRSLDELMAAASSESTTSINKSNDDVSDYLLHLDGGRTLLDGKERAKDRSIFSPCHLNHADANNNQKEDNNCFRIQSKQDITKVAFFTSRQIDIGEELCFDYGSNYWRGREEDKI